MKDIIYTIYFIIKSPNNIQQFTLTYIYTVSSNFMSFRCDFITRFITHTASGLDVLLQNSGGDQGGSFRSYCPLIQFGHSDLWPQPATHRGEEHGEDVDGGLQQVVAPDGDGHRRHKHEVTEAKQQGGEKLEAVGVGLRVVRAAPAFPA